MDSPEGQLSIEVIDMVFALLDNAQVDAKARQLIWTDGARLPIDASVKRTHAQHPELPAELIEDKLISWLEMDYEPAGPSQQQLDELDRLTEKWIHDHNNAHRPACRALKNSVLLSIQVRITYDQAKRDRILRDRGLDFEDAAVVFQGITVEVEDTPKDCRERRIICYGSLNGCLVVFGVYEVLRSALCLQHAKGQ